MPIDHLPAKVFISHSHQDSGFVSKLANDLMRPEILVWVDEWEIGVGDSLIDKIEEGISTSAYLAVVLTPRSVKSVWVREELKAALLRQLDEKRVVVLPLLVEECDIPLFLRDKKYADFREDYSSGLAQLIAAIKPPDLGRHGEGTDNDYHHDWTMEWGIYSGSFGFKVFISSHSQKSTYSVICNIEILANHHLSERLFDYVGAGYPWAPEVMLIGLVDDLSKNINAVILIDGDLEATSKAKLEDDSKGISLELDIRTRRLGPDPGDDLLYEWRSILKLILDVHRTEIENAIPQDERRNLLLWLLHNPL